MRVFDSGKKWMIAASSAILLLLWPWQAEAHLVTTGLGPVYDGVGHILLTPEDLVPVLALALFAGLRGTDAGKRTLFLLPVAWLVGGLAGMMLRASTTLPIPAISFLVLGLLVASDMKVNAYMVGFLAVLLGLVHGYLNGTTMNPGSDGVLELLGVVVTIFVLIALLAAFVISLRRPWMRIAVRVAGSWVTATGLLLLGWALKAS
jgi:urease accessory protein